MRYRHVVVSRHGGPDVLTLIESELPDPAPGEVRVAGAAAGVSGFDLMYRRWRWLPAARGRRSPSARTWPGWWTR